MPGTHCLRMHLIYKHQYFDVTFKRGLGLMDDIYEPCMIYLYAYMRCQSISPSHCIIAMASNTIFDASFVLRAYRILTKLPDSKK